MSEHSNQLLNRLLADPVREPPLFEWRDQLPFADEIIARVGAEKVNYSAIGRRSPQTDLTNFRDSIAKLLAELQEIYLVALGDHELRSDPKRPERKLRKKDMVIINAPAGCDFDYSEFPADPGQSWEKHYDEVYARLRGNPGRSRTGAPPVAPLHPIYQRIQRWWRQHELGLFSPTCMGLDERYYNSDSRFLLGIIQTLDPAYTIENARGLYETLRKNA